MTALPSSDFPPGDLRRVYVHWTAGDYVTTFDAYHFCIARDADDRPVVRATHDLRENMRDVRGGGPYAAHTAGRNSYAIGIAVCGMAGATPFNFGDFALRNDQVNLACAITADLCAAYAIAVDAEHVRTHAEAAVDDGYFGWADDERWDVARLAPSADPLHPREAKRVGDLLRARIAVPGLRVR